ncbi:MAG TPA: hypothetical protein DCM57_06655 [Treponema sp.]|nr:hypothetical protein [Treponema sp.]
MKILIAFLIVVAVLALIARLYVANDKKIQFFAKGLDSNFRFSEIQTLWKLAKKTEIEDPLSLYVSVAVLNTCIAQVINDAKEKNTDKSFQVQQFLTKLYDYRTRIALDTEGKRGIEDTRSLDPGQRVRIILSGKGVFAAKILTNGRELVISRPRQQDKKTKRYIIPECEMWIGHRVSVYLWRKGDACYAFDSTVFDAGVFQGQDCLFLNHSDKLVRTQKRQSVRCSCEIYAQMYMIKSAVTDYNAVNTEPGFKCLLEDISEDGAMIRIGGQGKTNVQIKLQFEVNDTFIMMYGVVRAVEYNKDIDQSRLHFECTHIEPAMKNAVLTYVYNVLPQEQKEIHEAITETESDSEGENEGEAEENEEKGTPVQDEELPLPTPPTDAIANETEEEVASDTASFFGLDGSAELANVKPDRSALNRDIRDYLRR